MANIALNKLPLEKGVWVRPELATDGESAKYDSHDGFAYAEWPVDYTLDLEQKFALYAIRFLLWDGNGQARSRGDRRYKFELSLANENDTFTIVFSNKDEPGDVGWFDFVFPAGTVAQYVRLSALSCSTQPHFHIVEFEIHDSKPDPINWPKLTTIVLSNDSGRIEDVISTVLEKKVSYLAGASERVAELDKTIMDASTLLKRAKFVSTVKHFGEEARSSNLRSIAWLISGLLFFIFILCYLLWSVYQDRTSNIIINTYSLFEKTKIYTSTLLVLLYVGKAVLLSVLVFVLAWIFRNYRSERHNYTVNTHKAMSLAVATEILVREDIHSDKTNTIFVKAAEIAFSHQTSGFSREEGTQDGGLVNQIISSGGAS